jgi:hypothetical protein
VDAVCAAGQKVVTVDGLTAGWVQDDVLIAQTASGNVERVEIDTIQTDVSLTMKANLVTALAAGDVLYKVSSQGSIPVAAATVAGVAAGEFGYMGCAGTPLLIDLDGTSACAINFVTVVYE